MSKFTHLHLHTVYSVLDGASKIKNLFEEIKKLGMDSVAITDHGNMYGALEFYTLSQKYGIKPIIGVETYVAQRSLYDKVEKQDRSGYHLCLFAKNLKGYQNLLHIVSVANLDGFYYKPRVDKDLLAKYSEGVIASSACLGGEVAKTIINKGEDEAIKVVEWYKSVYGDDYYLEVMDHGLVEQKTVNECLKRISKKTGVKLIATNDVHYIRKEDFEAHKVLIQINTKKEGDEGLFYTGKEYLKTAEEMEDLFSDIPEAIENTQEIVAKIENFSLLHDVVLPVFDIPEGFSDENEYLKYLAYEGSKKKYEVFTDEMKERMDFELDVIKTMGFPGYFLIVMDYIAKAREMGVLVGPGRGSAAGSIVAYCLDITNIDPIKYDLLFERFLNPDRISMPDIDVDFDDEGREKVINYVVEKYGKDRVAQIITFGKMAAKSSIKDVARVFNKEIAFANNITKLIPDAPKVTIESALKDSRDLKELYDSNLDVKKIVDLSATLEGNIRNTGVHACGVIIGRDPLEKYVPLALPKDKDGVMPLPVVQFEGSIVETAGMLKMDFLGLKTLSIIKDCLDILKKRSDISIDMNKISLDDLATFKLYQEGATVGTFQFESEGMSTWLKKLCPTNISDLIAMNALYRPGPMDYIPQFVNRKLGKEPIQYDIPIMDKYLKETYGITVYQEQVMLLSRLLANFSRGESDTLRKAMGKKQRDKLDKMKPDFIKRGEENGHDPKILEKIWSDWESFAKYAFNKSHAAAYTIVAFQTAYLKANYPAEYMSAVLANNVSDLSKITIYINECKRMGIDVLGPDINESYEKFSVNKDGQIRFGLSALKGVGGAAAQSIVAERNENGAYKNVSDFFDRISLRVVNKKSLEVLASTGAFNSLNTHCAQFFYVQPNEDKIFLDKMVNHAIKVRQQKNEMQSSLFGDTDEIEILEEKMPYCEEWKLDELLLKEKEYAGFYISGHPLDEFKPFVKLLSTCELSDLEYIIEEVREKTEQKAGDETDASKRYSLMMSALPTSPIIFAGVLRSVNKRQDKNGRDYLSFSVFDYSSEKDFRLFEKDFERLNFNTQTYDKYLSESRKYLFVASFNIQKWRNNSVELLINKIIPLENVTEKMLPKVVCNLDINAVNKSFTDDVKQILDEHRGNIPLYLTVGEKNSQEVLKMFSSNLKFNAMGIYMVSQLDEIRKYSVRNEILKTDLTVFKNEFVSDNKDSEELSDMDNLDDNYLDN